MATAELQMVREVAESRLSPLPSPFSGLGGGQNGRFRPLGGRSSGEGAGEARWEVRRGAPVLADCGGYAVALRGPRLAARLGGPR